MASLVLREVLGVQVHGELLVLQDFKETRVQLVALVALVNKDRKVAEA